MAEDFQAGSGGGSPHHEGLGGKLAKVPVWVWVVGLGLLVYLTWRIISSRGASSQVNQQVPAGSGGVNTDVQAALDAQKAALEADFAAGLTTQGEDITKAFSGQMTADEANLATLTTTLKSVQDQLTAYENGNGSPAGNGSGGSDVQQQLLAYWNRVKGGLSQGGAQYPDRPISFSSGGQTAYYVPGSGTGFVTKAQYDAAVAGRPVSAFPNGGSAVAAGA